MSRKYLLRENNSIGSAAAAACAADLKRGCKYVLHIVVKMGSYLKHTTKK